MNDGIEIERDETSDECNTMLGVSESREEATIIEVGQSKLHNTRIEVEQ